MQKFVVPATTSVPVFGKIPAAFVPKPKTPFTMGSFQPPPVRSLLTVKLSSQRLNLPSVRTLSWRITRDSNFAGSNSLGVHVTVTQATTTTTLLSSINPSVSGKPVTFTALVSSSAGTPTGKVQFLDGTTVLATRTLTSGSVKYTTLKLPPGANSITAIYEGDSNHSGSTSTPVNQIVLAVTTTTLSSSLNPSTFGEAVTFTAVVTPAPPDGETVTFGEGSIVLGAGSLSGGSASFTTSDLPAGRSTITAVYGGDSNLDGSTSKDVYQVIKKATTTTTLLSSKNPSISGKPITFTVLVSSPAGTPTGKVEYLDGTTILATVKLTSGSAKYMTTKLPLGSNRMTAVYEGDGSNFASSKSNTVKQWWSEPGSGTRARRASRRHTTAARVLTAVPPC